MTVNERSYYQILDIKPTESQNEIFHAYTRAKKAYSEESIASYSLIEGVSRIEIIEEIENAYEVLGNPSRRKKYDAKLKGLPELPESEDEFSFEYTQKIIQQKTPTTNSENVHKVSPQEIVINIGEGNAVTTMTETMTKTKPNQDIHNPENFVTPKYVVNKGFESELKDREEIDGAFINALRNYRKISLEQLSHSCKLSISNIEMIESEELPPNYHAAYLQGHVSLLCQELGLPNFRNLARTYVNRMRSMGKLPKPSY